MFDNLKEYEMITLEDGNEYAVAYEQNNYLLLVNPNDETDFCIRKNVVKDGQEFVESLDTDDEFDKALAMFAKFLEN